MLADDYAPQLALAELAALVSSRAAARPTVLLAIAPAQLAQLRGQVDHRRVDVIMRELVLLVRRCLRGSDAVALAGDELVATLDGPLEIAEAVNARVLAAVRAHLFTGGAADLPVRLTLSLGIAASPGHGTSFAELITAAQSARTWAGDDNAALAFAPRSTRLDLDRFVGRSEPLARLSECLDDMVRGVARVVAVVGEAGVGSTALLNALMPEVRLRGGSLVSAACHQQSLPEPYALWADVLRAVRRLPVKSTRLWRELPSLDASLERASADLMRGGSKMRLLEELADFLRLAAQQRPLFFVLDNMQWADDASWDALEYLIPQLESERIVLALTIRTGDSSLYAQERWSRLSSRPRHDEIRLTRLTRDDAKRWIEGAMSHGEAGRDLLAYLYRHTEGNPLLLSHLLRDLEESEHLARDGDGWRWSSLRELPADTSFDEVVTRRVARLPDECGPLLALAATLDRDFDEAMVRHAFGGTREDAQERIRCAVDARFLSPTYDRASASYRLTHDEIARVLRERLSAEQRAEYHALVAGALAAARAGSRSEIAAHYEAAGLSAETHQQAVLAAEDALAVYDSAAATTLLTLAARHASSPAALAHVRVRLATIAEAAERYEDAEALCDLALTWYESQDDRLQAIHLKRMRTLVRMQRGQTARETLGTLLALVAEAESAGADAEKAAILLVTSQVLARLGEPRESQRVAEECVAIAERCADPVLLADSCNRLALSLLLSDAPRARRLFARALELIVPLSDALRRARVLNNIGILELAENRWREARESLTAAVEFSRTAGLTEHWGRAELNLGVLAIRIGEYESAAVSLGEALRLCAEAQNTELQLIATYNLADLARELEQYGRAGATYELAMELADRIGQSDIHVGALAGMGLCRFAEGRVDEAIRLHELVQSRMATQPHWFQGRELVEALAIRLALRHERGEAAQIFKRAVELADTKDVYGAILLTAELGEALREVAPDAVEEALARYGARANVIGNPRLRDQFGVLMLDSRKAVDHL
jgi:predicted ATPase/GGDEF domain-containing protein